MDFFLKEEKKSYLTSQYSLKTIEKSVLCYCCLSDFDTCTDMVNTVYRQTKLCHEEKWDGNQLLNFSWSVKNFKSIRLQTP